MTAPIETVRQLRRCARAARLRDGASESEAMTWSDLVSAVAAEDVVLAGVLAGAEAVHFRQNDLSIGFKRPGIRWSVAFGNEERLLALLRKHHWNAELFTIRLDDVPGLEVATDERVDEKGDL